MGKIINGQVIGIWVGISFNIYLTLINWSMSTRVNVDVYIAIMIHEKMDTWVNG